MAVRWTRDPRKKSLPKAPAEPVIGPLDDAPKKCSGCGERVTQQGGFVELTRKGEGTKRFHYFGCPD